MERRVYDSKAVAERYGVSVETARKYMHLMGCKIRPLRVTEKQMADWDQSRSGPPVDYLAAIARNKKVEAMIMRLKKGELFG